MKKRTKNIIVGFCSMLLFAVVVSFLFLFQKQATELEHAKKILSEGPKFHDHADLAMAFEYFKRANRKTGKIPDGAYLQALKEAELIKSNQSKTMAAIPLTWTERGPNNVGGRTRTIMIDPNDGTNKTIFAAGIGGGIWKTTDITVASPVWTAVAENMVNIGVSTLAYDPSSTTTMYAGTGEGYFNLDAQRGAGIFKSTNGGATWTQLSSTNNASFYYTQKVVVTSAGVILAATSTGLRRSTDGGSTWTKVLGTGLGITGAVSNMCYDVEIAANGDVYASLDGSIHKSTTSGSTWGAAMTLPITAGRSELACAPSDANYVYALVESGSAVNGIIRTTNAGTSWASRTEPADADPGVGATDFSRGQAWYDLSIAVDPNNRDVLVVGGVDLFKSSDGAGTWTQISHWYGGFSKQYVHADQHIAIYQSGSSSVIYFGNDGGVWRSGDGGTTIAEKNTGYNVTQLYSVALNPTSGSNVIIGGAQDNGTNRLSTAGLGASTEPYGGDGGYCAFHSDATHAFATYVYNDMGRSNNNATSFPDDLTNYSVSSSNTQFINTFEIDPNSSEILYMGSTALWRLSNSSTATSGSAAWTQCSTNPTGNIISAIGISKSTANLVYFGTDDGYVYRLSGANATTSASAPTAVGTRPFGAAYVSCLAVNPANADYVLAASTNYGLASQIYLSANASQASPTWTSKKGNLPDMPIHWAIFFGNSTTQAIIGTELGIWTCDDISVASPVWGQSNTNFPQYVSTYQLRYRSSDYTLAAATHGRGIWTTSLASLLPVKLTDLKGVAKADGNLISWKTLSEVNNDYFELEHSENGNDFVKITQIKGAGNSNVPKSYSFLDNNLATEKYYYRLKQVDFDGKFEYSNTIMLENKISDLALDAKLFPNPVYDKLTVRFNKIVDQSVELKIYSIDGKLSYSSVVGDINSTEINIDANDVNLHSGVYLLSIRVGEKNIVQKFLKN